jgi:hypothetical protein
VARLALSAIVLVFVLMRCGAWAVDVAVVPRAPSFGAERDVRSLERRIDAGAADDMRAHFPEGGLFTLSFTGFALVNIAVSHPDDAALRASTRDELAHLLALSEREREQAPFSSWSSRGSWRGVILEGHQNLLRAGYAVLGGDDAKIIDDFHRTSAALFAGFVRSRSGALESFWGRTWYVANVVALESLRLHDVLYGTHYAIAREHFRDVVRVDAHSGLPASEVTLGGARVVDGPRGCALSWLLAFTPNHAWYARYLDTMSVDVAGMRGFREYPVGRAGHMDVDSGPILDDIGGAASAFGVAAARAHGDGETLGRMLLAEEVLAFPSLTRHGDEELFFGALPLTDAIAVWARTVTPWDEPRPAPSTSPPLFAMLIAELAILLPIVVAARWFLRCLTRYSASSDRR